MIRRLTLRDLDDAHGLSTAAGWNQTREDWLRILRLDPEACFGYERDGRIVSTLSALRYGRDLAWIGMVLTDPVQRGRGFARMLMEHALAWLDGLGVRRQRLDATTMGQPLYEACGFTAEYAVERWLREPREAPEAPRLPPADARVLDDAARFVLPDSESAAAGGGSYALTRPGRVARYFGPCRAASVLDARRLVAWAVSRHGGGAMYWDLAPANEQAAALAREAGFLPVRTLLRMQRGGVALAPDPCVFAFAGFEYG